MGNPTSNLRLVVVDAFTSRPFSGNPAAIAIVNTFPSEERMQLIAREMNLSETAFAVRIADDAYELRWFTPTREVDLCGHATLAAAHVIDRSVGFHTKSGILSCERLPDSWIAMDFPTDPPHESAPPRWLESSGMKWFGNGRLDALIEFDDAADVRDYQPDLSTLLRLPARAIVITARSDREEADFVSRVFCPSVGIAEDPVTGSAHCMLSEYWGEQLGLSSLTGEQVSSRGGVVRMERRGDRVILSGQARTVSTVEFAV